MGAGPYPAGELYRPSPTAVAGQLAMSTRNTVCKNFAIALLIDTQWPLVNRIKSSSQVYNSQQKSLHILQSRFRIRHPQFHQLVELAACARQSCTNIIQDGTVPGSAASLGKNRTLHRSDRIHNDIRQSHPSALRTSLKHLSKWHGCLNWQSI